MEALGTRQVDGRLTPDGTTLKHGVGSSTIDHFTTFQACEHAAKFFVGNVHLSVGVVLCGREERVVRMRGCV